MRDRGVSVFRGDRGTPQRRGRSHGQLLQEGIATSTGGAGTQAGTNAATGAGVRTHAGTARIAEQLAWAQRVFPGRTWLAIELHRSPDDAARLALLDQLGRDAGVPRVAAGDVHMHARGRRALQDLMTAIRHRTTVAAAGHRLFPNGERHLRPRQALAELYPAELMRESVRIAQRCRFSLRDLKYRYPRELVPEGLTPSQHLRHLTEEGARRRWPTGVPIEVRKLIERELTLIAELNYEPFFLTVQDVVAFARSRGILCQGRGSAANSVVCYCLGITAVDPGRIGMLFERFISKERNEPPDIDVDFEHERREEVLQYVYRKYGRERAALAATVISYQGKSAARDVGRALGFGEDQLDQIARCFGRAVDTTALEALLAERGFDPSSPIMHRFLVLVGELLDVPRHLSQHVGGFVISEQPLWELVPVENAGMEDRTIIQWDKDDLETLGLLKVDCLALGMLSCIRRCFDLVDRHRGIRHDLATIPEGDPATYRMIQAADTLGVFQIESRAQMAMLPRHRPENYYDLVIQVAIVRPGPIQGDMVHPFLRRRQKKEQVTYPSPELEKVFGRTLGVPIFQEQVMQLAIVAAGFTPGEADRLRRSMAAWKRRGGLEQWRERILGGMRERGYELSFAEQVFEQIKGFGSYGFPESHAASFALIVYASCWLKCHEPAAFACALINSQPMGFYAPAQIVADARKHGVTVLPADVAHSDWDCSLDPAIAPLPATAMATTAGAAPAFVGAAHGCDRRAVVYPGQRGTPDLRGRSHGQLLQEAGVEALPQPAIRLGLRLIRGISEDCARRIVAAREARPFRDVADLVARAALDRFERERLAEAGALRTLAGHRHRAFWAVAACDASPDHRSTPIAAHAATVPPRDHPAHPIAAHAAPTVPPGTPPPVDLLQEATIHEQRVTLRPPSAADDVFADYATTGLTLNRHPVALVRRQLAARRIRRSDELATLAHGTRIRCAGLVTLRQRPQTASGVTFLTLEDEHGLVNVVVWRDLAVRQRRELLESRLLGIDGVLETQDGVQHLIAKRLSDLTPLLDGLDARSRDFH